VLKRADGCFIAKPQDAAKSLIPVARKLDTAVLLTISSEVTRAILRRITLTQKVLWLQSRGTALPIVLSLEDDLELRRQSFACLCRMGDCLLVWDDDVQRLLVRGRDLEDVLAECVRDQHVSSCEGQLAKI
jgi:hypothetical protein